MISALEEILGLTQLEKLNKGTHKGELTRHEIMQLGLLVMIQKKVEIMEMQRLFLCFLL